MNALKLPEAVWEIDLNAQLEKFLNAQASKESEAIELLKGAISLLQDNIREPIEIRD